MSEKLAPISGSGALGASLARGDDAGTSDGTDGPPHAAAVTIDRTSSPLRTTGAHPDCLSIGDDGIVLSRA